MVGESSLRGHAVSHRRLLKAKKIEHLLGNLAGKRMLDLGTGSGLLAEYFASRGADVTAADRDAALFNVGLPFVQIEGTELPFADSTFDICIFNHVIEHVGPREKQKEILQEICRVLKPGGKLYLAVPNKWAFIEPHYKIPLLGAMPRGVANRLVQVFRDAPEYDCHPLSLGELSEMASINFSIENITVAAFHWFIRNEIESFRNIAEKLPAEIIPKGAFPTLIILCTKQCS